MEDIRERRLESELRATWSARKDVVVKVITQYVDSLPHNSIHPSKGYISNLDAFKTIYLDTPLEETLTQEHFNDAVLSIPKYTDEWRAAKDKELVELIKPQRPDVSISDLSLATTVFKCGTCSQTIRYPYVLIHDHRWGSNHPTENTHLRNLWDELQFHEQHWEYRNEYSEAIAMAIRECGLDPNVVTAAEMDGLNPFFECTRTDGVFTERWVVRWCSLARLSVIMFAY